MYVYEVLGFRKYSGEFEGRKYSGYFLHCSYFREGVEGHAVTEIKVKEKHGYVPRVGDQISVIYGPNGIDKIEVM